MTTHASLTDNDPGAFTCTVSSSSLNAHKAILASGSLVIHNFAGTSTGNLVVIDNNGFIYDGTNRRVGILKSAPSTALDVVGTLSGSLITLSNPTGQIGRASCR